MFIIVLIAGGYAGVLGAVLVITGASIVLGNCCSANQAQSFQINWILNIIAAICFAITAIQLFVLWGDLNKACSGASAQGATAHNDACTAANVIVGVAAGLNILWCGLSIYAIVCNGKAKQNPSAVPQQQAGVVVMGQAQPAVVVGAPVQAQVVQAQAVAQPAVVVGQVMKAEGDAI
jgi:hypothetical protein